MEKFAEDFIQPIMRGDAYDIEITDIDLINYQKESNQMWLYWLSLKYERKNESSQRIGPILS